MLGCAIKYIIKVRSCKKWGKIFIIKNEMKTTNNDNFRTE